MSSSLNQTYLLFITTKPRPDYGTCHTLILPFSCVAYLIINRFFLEEEPTVKPEEIVITEKYESLHIMTIGINRKRVNESNEH